MRSFVFSDPAAGLTAEEMQLANLVTSYWVDFAKHGNPNGGDRPFWPPYTAATVVNNIFRNYEHKWVYDLEEMTRTAMHAGIPESAVKRSRRMGADLPATLVEAIRRAETTGSARHQESAKENPTRCWLEQEIREQESLYVLITKPQL